MMGLQVLGTFPYSVSLNLQQCYLLISTLQLRKRKSREVKWEKVEKARRELWQFDLSVLYWLALQRF